ncbi:ribonuclease H [Streptomyces sp. Edi2]|uniref:ribonuclease H family protein n=1 Tax=Streptomyces sp. Edi2 TaxID=3162528 RepID=UPI003306391E
MTQRIIAACDGASKGNPGPAAWAWVIAGPDGTVNRWESGPLGTATNNAAELTALLRLLESTDLSVPLEIRMDSQYAMNAATTWLPGWRRRGWKTSAGAPVANRDLVARIDELLNGRDVTLVHVRAHQAGGDPYNAAADRAASQAARTQRPAGTSLSAAPPAPQSGRGAQSRGRGPDRAGSSRRRAARGRRGASTARFSGRCRCGKPYRRGELIAKDPAGWGHPACVTPATSAN